MVGVKSLSLCPSVVSNSWLCGCMGGSGVDECRIQRARPGERLFRC